MKDGIIKGTGNSRYLKSSLDGINSWEEFKAALLAGTLPIDLNGINAEGWQQLATALNKENLLKDTTSWKYFASGDHTMDEVLSVLGNSALAIPTTISAKPQGFEFSVGGFDFVKITDRYNGVDGNTLLLCTTELTSVAWNANNGAYLGGQLNNYLDGEFYTSLPEKIKSVVKTVDIRVCSGSTESTTITTVSRKVFAASRREIWDTAAQDGTYIPGFAEIVAGLGNRWTRTPTNNPEAAYIGNGVSTRKANTGIAFACIVIPSDYRVSWSITDVLERSITIPSAQLDKRVMIAVGSYKGTGLTGSSYKNTIPFPFKPEILFIQAVGQPPGYNTSAQNAFLIYGTKSVRFQIGDNIETTIYLSWSSAEVSWYAQNASYGGRVQLNESNETYKYIMLASGENL